MDMKVKPDLIKSERERRAWSQQHLSTVSGLALRTIQRIETTGTASHESVKALASCLELPIAELLRADQPAAKSRRHFDVTKTTLSAGGAVVLAVVAALSMHSAVAQQVLLDLGVTMNEQNEYFSQVLLDDGENIELRMDGIFSLVVTPTIARDGEVVVAFKVYEYRDDDYQLLSEPRVVALSGEEAAIELGADSERGSRFRIAFTPQIQ